MRLTTKPPYKKSPPANKVATRKQLVRWSKLAAHGCVICKAPAEIHHAKTGAGGRKNHDLVFGLCANHHRGPQGIHHLGRKVWEEDYCTEDYWLAEMERLYPIES